MDSPGGLEQEERPRAPWWVLGVLALWGLTLLRPTLSNGDAATYLSQIRALEPFLRTIHIGYFLTSLPLVHFLPGDPAWRLNLVSLLWTLAGAVALMRLERRTDPDAQASSWSVVWCTSFPPLLLAATTAEVYPAQTALTLWALVLWGRGRPLAAGLTWFAAVSVSPAALAAFPAFWLFPGSRRDHLKLYASMLVPLTLLVWGFSSDYLWGIRGVLTLDPGMGLGGAAVFRLSALPTTVGLGLLVLPAGVSSVLEGRWPEGRRLVAAAIGSTLAVWLLVDRFRDVPAYGVPLCLLALLMARGARVWWTDRGPGTRTRRALLLACLAVQVFLGDQAARAERRREARFAETSRAVYASLRDHGVVVGDFSTRRLYEFYAVGKSPAGLTAGFEVLRTLKRDDGHLPCCESREPRRSGATDYRVLALPSRDSVPEGIGLVRMGDGSWRVCGM